MTAFFMATALAVAPAPPAPTHEVLPGESLTWIAQCELGDANRWSELWELNREQIPDPDIILPGSALVLPQPGTGECPVEPPVQLRPPASSPSAPTRGEASRPRAVAAPQERARPASSGLGGIRQCESGGDYGAVSANGRYRGAYQFDRQTWQSVGGSGDPAAASPAEQDRRAQALYRQRGSSPWPSCG